MWDNFKAMPTVLKFLTVHAIACVAFFIGSIIPHGSFFIDGRMVTYAQWWQSGAGIKASILGVILPLCGYMLLKRISYSRVAYVGAFSMPAVIYALDDAFAMAFFWLGLVALIVWYLLAWQSVRVYFDSNQTLKKDAA